MSIVTQRGTIHIDKYLTNMSIKYASQQNSFIFDKLFPAISVGKQTDKLVVYDTGAGRRIENDVIAPRTTPNKVISWKISDDNYYCDPHALSDDYTDDDIANFDSPLDPGVDTMQNVVENMMLIKEKNAAGIAFAAGNYTNTAAASGKWDAEIVDPRTDVDIAINTVRLASGVRPNVGVMNFGTYLALTKNPYVASYLSDGADKDVNLRKLAAYFKLDNILLAEATYNSAKEGQATTNAYIWTDNFLVAYVNPKPALRRPSLGYEYGWKPYGLGKTMLVRKFYEERKRMTHVDVYNYYDQKLTMEKAGYLITDVLT